MENQVVFKKKSFRNRLKSMLSVDFGRMFKSKLFYILIATSLLIPVVMVVMLAMMDGTVSRDPQTGAETVMEGPENAWESIGTLPTDESEEPADDNGDMAAMGGMGVMSMCNINMMFMLVAAV